MLPRCLPPSFRSLWLTVQVQVTLEVFQDGCNGDHQRYESDGDFENVKTDGHTDEGRPMVNKPRHKLTWSTAPGELTIEYLQDGCCNSESLCYPNASYQVLAQSDLQFGSRWGLKIFKMATLGAISDIGPQILAILNLNVTPMPPIKFRLNPYYGFGNVVWRISR